MDTRLWTKIAEFNIDGLPSEYGFSTRLANENFWTINFTQKAILEYKKFMYLAGTSDLMVSPSEIIDVVWHQHLIFTQSYTDFCNIIGKNIQHVPSTHNREDAAKFRQAKERTRKLYNSTFGEQPKDIWEYSGMYESLHLKKARFKVRSFVIAGILAFIFLIAPSYYLLKPVYIHVNNPAFLTGYILLALAVITGLIFFNRFYLSGIVKRLNEHAFLHDLQPAELVYLKTQDLPDVVHGHVNRMINESKIKVGRLTLQLDYNHIDKPNSIEEFTIVETLTHLGDTNYSTLLKHLVNMPVFRNIANSMNAFKKYFTKSTAFGRLFYFNFTVFSVLLMLGLVRVLTGILNHKPVSFIFITLAVLLIIIIIFLEMLPEFIVRGIVPWFYKNTIIPQRKDEGDSIDWRYFLMGTAAFSPVFIPVINHAQSRAASGSSGSSGTSCGSSCSSCGGCGGCGS